MFERFRINFSVGLHNYFFMSSAFFLFCFHPARCISTISIFAIYAFFVVPQVLIGFRDTGFKTGIETDRKLCWFDADGGGRSIALYGEIFSD